MRIRSVVLVALLAACGAPAPPAPTPAPDAGKRLVAEHAVVTSAHPRASEAGVDVLRRGGNAVDAAVATAFAVSVGEPQMSGMGGGGAILVWLAGEGRAEYLDFYSANRPESFRGLPAADSARGALREVGIPGAVAGLLEVHQRFGRLPRAAVLAPAIRLAKEGLPINQVLAQLIAHDSAKLARYPESARVFLPGGRPLQPGEMLRQPDLAATLRRVAEQGPDGFYRGPVARELVRALNGGGHPATPADLAEYTPQWKRPLCGEYRGYVVLSAPPPQSGMQIIHTLELLEPFDLRALGLPVRSAPAFDALVSALRVGMADHRANDDPRWASVPAVGTISEAFARSRAPLVGTGAAPDTVHLADALSFDSASPPPSCLPLDPYREAAQPPPATTNLGPEAVRLTTDGGETTHLSVVDAEGNAVALTQTNSSLWGSGARVAGFFLNDSGYDGSGDSIAAGRNLWRTRRSTISPTILLRDGRVQMVVGAPGGGRIPTAMIQTMVYVLDYGLDPLEALRMPRIFPSATSRRVQLENGFDAGVLRDARAMGYEPAALSFGYARLYMIARRDGRWIGVADPRHDGGARGY